VRAIVAVCLTVGLVACSTTGAKTGTPVRTNRQPIQPEESIPNRSTTSRQGADSSDVGRLLTAYFDYDESALRADAKGALRQNAELLKQRANARVELQGNCDERGTDEYNMALGKRRADAAKRYLEDLGIAEGRITTVSFGEENPAVQGHNEAAWAKNRRVDFVLR
jgi:peptidoglycan-associated lipoprotein